jgi:PKD repeat protein
VNPLGERVSVNSSTTPNSELGPVAVADVTPAQGIASLQVSFDGTNSEGNVDPIASYSWDYGDGSEPAGGSTTLHAYETAGTYHPTLTVTDGAGRSDVARETVKVYAKDQPPKARLTVYSNPRNDSRIYVDGSQSGDPDGQTLKYLQRFGDGSRSHKVAAFHRYRSNGKYRLRLRVKDSGGLRATAIAHVRVTQARRRG